MRVIAALFLVFFVAIGQVTSIPGTVNGTITNATWNGNSIGAAYQDTKFPVLVHPLETYTVQTDIPAAVTEYPPTAIYRGIYDFGTNAASVRLICFVGVAGNAGSVIKAQYSIDSGSNWNDLGASCSLTNTGLIDSGWGAIATNAKTTSVLIRFATSGGNAVADPGLTIVRLYVK